MKKCLVLDCDGTLWGWIATSSGSVLIDERYRQFQEACLALYKAGVILALASRNDIDVIWNVFDNHPDMVLRRESISAWWTGASQKAIGLAAISDELNIGLDSLVLFDDDQREREAVRSMVPEVHVIDVPGDPALYRETILNYDGFDTSTLTEEDLRRGSLYSDRKKRLQQKRDAVSEEEFLHGLGMRVTIEPVTTFSVRRVVQLCDRVHKFNLSGRKYSEGEVLDGHADVRTIRVSDRIGDMGIVGAIFIRDKYIVEQFVMSCRALNYGIQEAVLSELQRSLMLAEYVPTDDNRAVASLLSERGELSYNWTVLPVRCPGWIYIEARR